MKKFIEALEEVRWKEKLSKIKMAQSIGVSYQTYWTWIAGKGEPRYSNVVAVFKQWAGKYPELTNVFGDFKDSPHGGKE